MEQNIKTFKLRANIITPIHIDNNEVYDRLDYFVFEDWNVVQIVDRKWLYDCAEKDKELFDKIIESLENGDFVSLEDYKAEYYEKYFDTNKFLIYEIPVWNNALKFLLQDKDYRTRKDIKWNLWEIKKFSRFGGNNEIIIPWSTLKGIFRTIYLQKLAQEKLNKDKNYIKVAEELEKLNNKFNKDFANIFFEDVKVENPKIKIQQLALNTGEKSTIPVMVETLVGGSFEIVINYDENNEEIEDFIEHIQDYLKAYSELVISREERIFGKFEDIDTKILDTLNDELNQKRYPIKIGMFKKSLAYKLFWGEELDDVYNKLVDLLKKKKRLSDKEFENIFNSLKLEKFWFKNATEDFKKWYIKNLKKKPKQVVWQKLWIWDRSFYVDENQNPIWWISLEIKN